MVMRRAKGSLKVPPTLFPRKENDPQRRLQPTRKEAGKQSQYQDLKSLPDQKPFLNLAK